MHEATWVVREGSGLGVPHPFVVAAGSFKINVRCVLMPGCGRRVSSTGREGPEGQSRLSDEAKASGEGTAFERHGVVESRRPRFGMESVVGQGLCRGDTAAVASEVHVGQCLHRIGVAGRVNSQICF